MSVHPFPIERRQTAPFYVLELFTPRRTVILGDTENAEAIAHGWAMPVDAWPPDVLALDCEIGDGSPPVWIESQWFDSPLITPEDLADWMREDLADFLVANGLIDPALVDLSARAHAELPDPEQYPRGP